MYMYASNMLYIPFPPEIITIQKIWGSHKSIILYSKELKQIVQ